MRYAIAVTLAAFAATVGAQPNPYRTLPLGSVSAVYPGTEGFIWVAERCGGNDCVGRDAVAPIRLYLGLGGTLLGSFGA
jgi:hypothetical protein